MNTVNLTGRLTHEVEIKETPSRKHVVDFQIAIREGKDETTFIRCQAWEQSADYLGQYSTKGSLLEVTGSLKVDRYKDKEDKTVEKTYVRAQRVSILDKRKNDLEGKFGYEPNKFGATQNNMIEESDLPFY